MVRLCSVQCSYSSASITAAIFSVYSITNWFRAQLVNFGWKVDIEVVGSVPAARTFLLKKLKICPKICTLTSTEGIFPIYLKVVATWVRLKYLVKNSLRHWRVQVGPTAAIPRMSNKLVLAATSLNGDAFAFRVLVWWLEVEDAQQPAVQLPETNLVSILRYWNWDWRWNFRRKQTGVKKIGWFFILLLEWAPWVMS